MKHQVARVVIHAIDFSNIKNKEVPTLDAAHDIFKQHTPAYKQEVAAKARFSVYWADGAYAEFELLLHELNEEREMHPRQAIFRKLGYFAGIAQPMNTTHEQYMTDLSLNAENGDVDGLQLEAIRWMCKHDIGYGGDYFREITAEELADLPEKWENPKIDTRIYYQCAMEAWEVKQWMYEHVKELGGLCQKYQGRYYIA